MAESYISHEYDSGVQILETDKLSSGSIYYRIHGNMFYFGIYTQFLLKQTIPAGTNILLGVIPEGYRPYKNLVGVAQQGNRVGIVIVGSDGNTFLLAQTGDFNTTQTVWFSVCGFFE